MWSRRADGGLHFDPEAYRRARQARDYVDWLTPDRLVVEEALWAESKLYLRYAAAIRRLVREQPNIDEVLEFGAGTGWVPTALDDLGQGGEDAWYTLVDRNPGCLALAREKHVGRLWVQIIDADIRTLHPVTTLVCGFAVLKHFRLDEWQQLFVQLFSRAPYGLFTTAVGPNCVDTGTEFTHSEVTEAFLAEAIGQAGHSELWRDGTDPAEPLIAIQHA